MLRGRIEAFARSHDLDAEQTERLQELALETLSERMALRRSVGAGELDREEALEQLEERRKAFEDEVLELVGPEGLEELREALRPSRRGPSRRLGM